MFPKALAAMTGPDEEFARELFRVGRILDQKGLGGSYLIRAVVFAYAGVEDRPFVRKQLEAALGVFETVPANKLISDIAEEDKGTQLTGADSLTGWPILISRTGQPIRAWLWRRIGDLMSGECSI